MSIPSRFLDELKDRVAIAEVVGRKVKLTRKGREHQGLCPFHQEKTPSFTVNEEKGFYHCFGCGAHGSAIDFLINAEGLSFPEAVERLAQEAGMEVPRDTPEEKEKAARRADLYDVVELAAAYFERMLKMPEGLAGLEYLRSRGLDDATIARFRLGFAPDLRGGLKGALSREGIDEDRMVEAGLIIRPEEGNRAAYDRFRGRVMFPITDRRGRVVAFGGRIIGPGEPKYLNSPETPLFHKGRLLYGLANALPAARKAGVVVVAEGYMDVIALNRAGIEHAVAPLGTALTEDQMIELWKIVPEPVLCFDGDNAGQRAAGRAAERSLPLLKSGFGLRFAVLPPGEDPDSLVAKGGSEAFNKLLAASRPLSEMLWLMESGGRIPRDAEEKAALQRRLEEQARRIQDSTLRSHILRGFRDRLWQRPERPGHGGRFRQRPEKGLFDARAARAADFQGLSQMEKDLIAAIAMHPELFHWGHVEEDMGGLQFSDPGLDSLRQEMVGLLSEDREWTAADLARELTLRGSGPALDVVLDDPLVRGHRGLRRETPIDAVAEVWTETMARLRMASLTAETDSGADDDFETEARRLISLKTAQHGEG